MRLKYTELATHGITVKLHKDSLELIPNIPWSDETIGHFEHFTESINFTDRERDDLADHVTATMVILIIKSCLR